MGYIDDNLLSNEKVVFRTRLNVLIFVNVPLAVLLFSMIVLSGTDTASMLATLVAIIIVVIVPWEVLSYIRYVTSEFGVTNRRVLIKHGFIRRNSIELLLSKIESIQVTQGIFGRLFNYGTLDIKGTGGTGGTFAGIDSPFEFRKSVHEQIEFRNDGTSARESTPKETFSKLPVCHLCGNDQLQYIMKGGGKMEMWCPGCKQIVV